MSGAGIEISDILINLLSSAIAVEYMDHGFEKKYTGNKRYRLLLFGFVLYYLVVTLMNRWMAFEGLMGACYAVALIIYACLALKGTVREKIWRGALWVVIALFSAYLVFVVLGLMTGEDLGSSLNSRNELKMYLSVAGTIFKFSLGRLVLALMRHRSKGAGQMEEWVMSGAFFMIFILAVCMFRLELGDMSQNVRYYLYLWILVGFCGIIAFLKYFYRKLEKGDREANQLRLRNQEKEKQEEQIKNLWQMNREANRIRHNMKGKLDIIYRLAEKGEMDSVVYYIEQMDREIRDYPELPQDTKNVGLNAALIKCCQECHDRKIDFRYMVVGNMSLIDSMDMGILFYNLLSNAIEACEKAEEDREIDLNIWNENNKIYCQLENSICESVLKNNVHMETTKQDKELHGYGMKSIHEIISRYKGMYNCWEEEEVFHQEFLLLK